MSDANRAVNQHLERLLRGEGQPADIVDTLEGMSPRELTAILPGLFSTGTTGEQRKALRDTANAVLYRKLADSLNENIKALDQSATRLATVGWWITIVVGVVGVLVSVAVAYPLF